MFYVQVFQVRLQNLRPPSSDKRRFKVKDHRFLPLPPLPPETRPPRAINLSESVTSSCQRESVVLWRTRRMGKRRRGPSNDSASRHVSRYASYGNVSGRGRKRKKKASEQGGSVDQGGRTRTCQPAKPHELEQTGKTWRKKKREREREREKYITSAARTDVIFIPGPGRGQRGHQRTADE